jgi:hypothetical protein
LISSEFAEEERSALVPGTSENRKERRDELRHLNDSLKAMLTLDHFSKAVQVSEDLFGTTADYFLIQYDNENRTVTVSPYHKYSSISDRYITEEKTAEESENPKNAVLVEADAIEDLKAAYPNYFLDVQMFLERAVRFLS